MYLPQTRKYNNNINNIHQTYLSTTNNCDIQDNNKKKVSVVTGSKSGIGLETSLTLARDGFLTYATMRNVQQRSSS
jgi:hypothetical protein